jgi:hypothetical protein
MGGLPFIAFIFFECCLTGNGIKKQRPPVHRRGFCTNGKKMFPDSESNWAQPQRFNIFFIMPLRAFMAFPMDR